MTYRSPEDATRALHKALERADNPTGAARELGRIVRAFHPDTEATREAFRHNATEALSKFYGGDRRAAKAVAWPVCDGCEIDRNGAEPPREDHDLPEPVCALGAEVPPPPSFLVGRLLLDRELHLVASDGGVGKTSTVLSVCGAYAAGVPPFDHPDFAVPPEGGDVLFVSEEDGLGVILNRLGALVRGHGWDRDQVLGRTHLFAQAGASLDDGEWQAHLLETVKALDRPLVVFDPLAELTLAQENSNDETKPIVRFLRLLTTEAEATVILLHHAGKAAEGKRKIDRAVRGASAWYSAARAVYFLDRTELGVSVECLKMNRAEMPSRFVLKRDVEAEPDNSAAWTRATLTYLEETVADDLAAERFVLDVIRRHPGTNSTGIKEAAKTQEGGPNAIAVSEAISTLHSLGRIDYEKGAHGAHEWRLTEVAGQGRQGRLPGLPNVAGQPEKGAPDDLAQPSIEAGKVRQAPEVAGQGDDEHPTDSGNFCACGNPIGPSAEQCAACRYGTDS